VCSSAAVSTLVSQHFASILAAVCTLLVAKSTYFCFRQYTHIFFLQMLLGLFIKRDTSGGGAFYLVNLLQLSSYPKRFNLFCTQIEAKGRIGIPNCSIMNSSTDRIKLKTFVALTMDVASASPCRYFFEARLIALTSFCLVDECFISYTYSPVV